MMAATSLCQACGWEFYGFGYAGEPCSAECDKALRSNVYPSITAASKGKSDE